MKNWKLDQIEWKLVAGSAGNIPTPMSHADHDSILFEMVRERRTGWSISSARIPRMNPTQPYFLCRVSQKFCSRFSTDNRGDQYQEKGTISISSRTVHLLLISRPCSIPPSAVEDESSHGRASRNHRPSLLPHNRRSHRTTPSSLP